MMPSHARAGARRHGRARRRLLLPGAAAAVPAASTILAVAACAASAASPAPGAGTALVPGYDTIFGLAPIRPGTQLGLLYADVSNKSRSPVTLSSVALVGRGAGTVIKVLEVKIAPLAKGNKAVPGGAYEVYPPAAYWPPAASCGKQPLVPLPGFRLAPGQFARVWFRIQGAARGTFNVKGDVVHYRQSGVSYRQFIPTGYKGSVSPTAAFIPIDKEQARCIQSEHVRPLRGQYLRKPKNYG
jgi:hypothetical protein